AGATIPKTGLRVTLPDRLTRLVRSCRVGFTVVMAVPCLTIPGGSALALEDEQAVKVAASTARPHPRNQNRLPTEPPTRRTYPMRRTPGGDRLRRFPESTVPGRGRVLPSAGRTGTEQRLDLGLGQPGAGQDLPGVPARLGCGLGQFRGGTGEP